MLITRAIKKWTFHNMSMYWGVTSQIWGYVQPIFIVSTLTINQPICAQNKLLANESNVHTVSSFPTVDYFSTLTLDGTFAWEVPFQSKIHSFKSNGKQVFIFSQARDESAFFLSCFNIETGKLEWEKGISAPQTPSDEDTTPP